MYVCRVFFNTQLTYFNVMGNKFFWIVVVLKLLYCYTQLLHEKIATFLNFCFIGNHYFLLIFIYNHTPYPVDNIITITLCDGTFDRMKTCWSHDRMKTCWSHDRMKTCWSHDRMKTCWSHDRMKTCWSHDRMKTCWSHDRMKTCWWHDRMKTCWSKICTWTYFILSFHESLLHQRRNKIYYFCRWCRLLNKWQ